ncbi:uncharacterized protein Z518_00829 [Rhinocladiella mackenziei CBS 650.93]|uniref:DUF1275 domain protein n=1 Tax=Rhinocladiella mackenziei CBS 650.93 TaxID=1442369 RepID=A0A0D2HGD6_9EURO|nr:uncharacterized protein Z518_00829 [Rhinocladiella mackenziei CBS 650.93]KIX09748.1 hypothetical protein Z518_00829 [Rhinocladiella mackenziei CBS 650.93]
MDTPQSIPEKDGTMSPDAEFPRPTLPWSTRLVSRFTSDVDPRWADIILIGCFFVAGIVDGVAFNTYTCFVSMQTGNTIFAGLGVSDLPSDTPKHTWVKSLVAILSFCQGAFFFSRFHRYLGPLKRWVITASFLIQTTLMIITALLISTGVAAKTEPELASTPDGRGTFAWVELCPIALLAFQSAGQIVASRVLKYNSMPTVVLTSLYCDLMSDPNLLTAGLFEDPDRNRRAVSAVILFVGATIGGALTKTSVSYSGALWIATGIKGSMVLAWTLWRPKTPQRQ